jgi:CDGSH-type Zn-finger protein/uncharacterized Fe-S cluster protein YjdI
VSAPTREQLLHCLYEAAELEHDIMCTYLYAAFSIKADPADGITAEQAVRGGAWRRAILEVAIEEMSHLAAVWNITSALGGTPHFGRGNFPIEPGPLPADVVARLAPFDAGVLQHFIYLERPDASKEPDGPGFTHATPRLRASPHATLTPMPLEYATLGTFYTSIGDGLRAFVEEHGEDSSFCNDPALQLTAEDTRLPAIAPVRCSKTALAAMSLIVEQGEGAPEDFPGSHFNVFSRIRGELADAVSADRTYVPAFPAARDPVLRPPVYTDRVWITDGEAAATVDLANACYGLMLRLLAYAYQVPSGDAPKRLAIDLGLGLMHAMAPVAERAVRLPAGPAHPGVNAGMTFTALRDAAPLPAGTAWGFFGERFDELVGCATALARSKDARVERSLRMLTDLAKRAQRAMPQSVSVPVPLPVPVPVPVPAVAPDEPATDGGKRTPGRALSVIYDGKRCIHARFCVTGAPKVFKANVSEGPWIFPDEGDPERIVELVHSCPSGALHYERADGKPEPVPEVNLLSTREHGPYAVRADVLIDGAPAGYRMTLCRCGESQNKPFCDNSHIAAGFDATGEPPSTKKTEMLPERAGPLAIDPELDGPLHLTGNVEIVSGTNRVVARVTHAKLCRCGASATKPFCDQSHRRIGFKSVP